MNKWGIKLGSAGLCVPFCEKHGIIGVGWKDTSVEVLTQSTRDELREHVRGIYGYADNNMLIGQTAGQLYRFGQECQVGDIIVYYVPGQHRMEICKVTSEPAMRDFDMGDDADIWLVRKVERIKSVSTIDAPAALTGSVMGPRMSFWTLNEAAGNAIDYLLNPPADDTELKNRMKELRAMLAQKLQLLNERDWEKLTEDYFRQQGAHIEGKVGGNRPVVDVVARFDHGEIMSDRWLVQVKTYSVQNPVDQPELDSWLSTVNEVAEESRLCFVSVNGFTSSARQYADDKGIYLMESVDFLRFVLTGRIRDELRHKMQIPEFWQL